jgi:hypothetical protein
MVKQGSMVTLSIPMHSEIDRGTPRKLIDVARALYRRVFGIIVGLLSYPSRRHKAHQKRTYCRSELHRPE